MSDSRRSALKILHVTRAPVGGIFRHILDLAEGQIARGHQVGIVCDSMTGGERAAAALAALAPVLPREFLGEALATARSIDHEGDRSVALVAALAALVPVLPSREEFPYSIRQVSEALSSNGSTSMGSVCASTMSLYNAGVPLKAPVAGIAMGLVSGEIDGEQAYPLIHTVRGVGYRVCAPD